MKWSYQKLLGIAIITYIVFFGIYSTLRHYAYVTNAYDLGIFMQSLWTTSHNQGFFFNTPEWEDLGVYSHFGVHNSPILFVLVPVYQKLPYAETLLILQTIALGLGALILFKFGKMIIGEHKAFYLAIIYLANPLIQGINQFDFHPVSLIVPIIFLIPYYYEKRNYFKMTLVSLLVLTAKEDAGLILISLGAFFIIKKCKIHSLVTPKILFQNLHEIRWEASLIVLGIIWILISLFLIIPHYSGGVYPYLHDSRVQRYSTSISDLHIDYIVVFFLISILSVMFIPLAKPEYFITSLPLWIELILPAKTTNMVTVGYQYPYMLAPFLFILSTYTLSENTPTLITTKVIKHKIKTKVTIKKAAIFSFIFMLLISPPFQIVSIPYIRGVPIYELAEVYEKWSPYFQVLDNITTTISNSNCPISTQNTIFPHLSNRNNTYVLITCFRAIYLPNDSILLLASSLPDYEFTEMALRNSTIIANKTYYTLNINTAILKCYAQTGENTKEFKSCIANYTSNIIQECEEARNHGKRG